MCGRSIYRNKHNSRKCCFAIIAGAGSTPFVLNLVERFLMPMDPIQAMNVTLIAMLLFCLIEATVYFLVTKYLLTKKLNLE